MRVRLRIELGSQAVVDEWACVAVFEFASGTPERVELFRGDETRCLRLAQGLERAARAGRGLRYEGTRTEHPLHAIAAVCRVSALADPEPE